MKRFTPFLLSLILLLALVPANHAVEAKDNWISVRSPNFLLVGNAAEKDVRQVAVRLEQFRDVFTRLFPKAKLSSSVATTVIVFKSDKSYSPFKSNPNTVGYFQPGPDVNYITLSTEPRGAQDPFTVIFHEYTHLMVNNTMGNPPAWFNEGLAEYYSTFFLSGESEVTLGRPISNHVYLLRDSKMLPLPTLFKVDYESPYYNEKEKQSIFYAQSWALMHYLIHKPGGSAAVNRFVSLMNGNKSMEDAFQQSFQTTFENMEKEIRAYIKRDNYPVIASSFQQKIALEAELQVAPISEADANAYLGDLLLHSRRAESEEYLQKALALEANHSMANASLAMLRVREGKIAEARSNLERAVTANSRNYLIHYYYAYALSREGMTDSLLVSSYSKENVAKMRAELQRAIALRPDFPESYGLLAFINLVAGTELEGSIAQLKQVLAKSPGRNDFALILAQLYFRTEDMKSARDLLEKLSRNQTDAEIREQAQGILKEIADYEENVARFNTAGEASGGEGRPVSQRRSNGDSKEVVTDPLSFLQDALRKPAAGEKQVQGALLRLDCDAKGIVFVVKLPDRTIKLRTAKFENIKITAYTDDAGSELSCGPRKTQNPVVVSYQPTTNPKARHDGEARSVEFVPKDFKLKVQP